MPNAVRDQKTASYAISGEHLGDLEGASFGPGPGPGLLGSAITCKPNAAPCEAGSGAIYAHEHNRSSIWFPAYWPMFFGGFGLPEEAGDEHDRD